MQRKNSERRKREYNNAIGLLIIVGIILVYIFFNSIYDFNSHFDVNSIKHYINIAGFWSPLVYMVTMAIAIVISPIPSMPLAAAAGVVWGPVVATIYSVIGAEVGAILAFLIARSLGKGFVEKHFKRQIKICYRCSESYLFWIVLISRLFPFFHFDIISYGSGLTNMRLKSFAIATFFGMIPMTFLFAYLGNSLVFGKTIVVIASLVVIAGFFVVPLIIEKYNFLGLKGKIILKKK